MYDMEEITENMLFRQCDKIVNETWSKTAIHYDKLKEIVLKGGPENDYEQSIIMIAANATLQKMTLDRASDQEFLNSNEAMADCGLTLKRDCPCDRPVCLMTI